jgi:hypothetical protein
MAGAEGELLLLGSTNGGDDEDRYQINLMADSCRIADWDKQERRLRAMTRMLVRRHQALIERTATALLHKTTMSGPQLDRLIGRSVDDVKVNAPMLLAMHRQIGQVRNDRR